MDTVLSGDDHVPRDKSAQLWAGTPSPPVPLHLLGVTRGRELEQWKENLSAVIRVLLFSSRKTAGSRWLLRERRLPGQGASATCSTQRKADVCFRHRTGAGPRDQIQESGFCDPCVSSQLETSKTFFIPV